ncbi:hypothetical protein C8R44DRAFT_852501 [Mycena epipterygia]|nr:hypothetical protein C8R44DRAFT_852501 [Mycena epipterygia]
MESVLDPVKSPKARQNYNLKDQSVPSLCPYVFYRLELSFNASSRLPVDWLNQSLYIPKSRNRRSRLKNIKLHRPPISVERFNTNRLSAPWKRRSILAVGKEKGLIHLIFWLWRKRKATWRTGADLNQLLIEAKWYATDCLALCSYWNAAGLEETVPSSKPQAYAQPIVSFTFKPRSYDRRRRWLFSFIGGSTLNKTRAMPISSFASAGNLRRIVRADQEHTDIVECTFPPETAQQSTVHDEERPGERRQISAPMTRFLEAYSSMLLSLKLPPRPLESGARAIQHRLQVISGLRDRQRRRGRVVRHRVEKTGTVKIEFCFGRTAPHGRDMGRAEGEHALLSWFSFVTTFKTFAVSWMTIPEIPKTAVFLL